MSETPTFNENETIRDLAASISEVRRVAPGASPHVIVPSGYNVNDLERLLPQPLRVRAKMNFSDPESFNRYLMEHKNDQTRVYGSESKGVIEAIIDHHGKEDPKWGQHLAFLHLTQTPEWTAWLGANRKVFTQVEFAEFIEERAGEVTDPSAANMMEMALTLKGKTDVAWTSSTRLETGAVSLGYDETIRGVTGKDSIEIPTRFKITIPVFKGTAPFILECMLRWRFTKEQGVTFHFIIQKWEKAKEQAFKDVLGITFEATAIKPFISV